MDEKGVRFSVFCDLDGKVTQVIKDDDHFLPQTVIGSLIFSIVVPSDLDKIINFFLELKSKSTAIGWEINIATVSIAINAVNDAPVNLVPGVITSYSIHYTKLYELQRQCG